MRVALVALLLVGSLAACRREPAGSPVVAHRLTTETVRDAVSLPGQQLPAQADTITLWLSPTLARRDTRAGSFLVDLEHGILTMVDHDARTYVRGTAEQVFGELAHLAADSVRGDDRRTRRLQSLLDVAAKVTDTGEMGMVDGYRCRRWVVEQRFGKQDIATEVWLTTDLDVDYALLQRVTQPALLALPGGDRALAELSRLEGVPVRATALVRVLGQETRSESRLVAAERDTLSPSFFRPPPGYQDVSRISE